MSKGPENDGGVLQRRVYALSPTLVERIEQFQKRRRLPSETEAVRTLLDKALNDEDDYDDLIERFVNDLKETEDLSESAKNILIGHPLVKSVAFQGKWRITFETEERLFEIPLYVHIDLRGVVEVLDSNGASYPPSPPPKPLAVKKRDAPDDEIPF